jgi:hypothetical protein
MSGVVPFLLVVISEEELGEGGNGGLRPKIRKISDGGECCNKMHITIVGFTLIDEPNPPLRCQLVLNHKFYKLKNLVNL